MKTRLAMQTLAATVLCAGLADPGYAATVYKHGDQQIDVGGRLQLLSMGELLDNGVYSDAARTVPYRMNTRLYMFQKHSRLSLSSRNGEYKLFSQLGLGAEDVTTPNVGLSLLDLYGQIPVGIGTLRFGQMKVAYGREQLTEEGAWQFSDLSVQNLGFRMGRDVGFSLETHPGPATVLLGMYTGGGRSVPERYLPENFGVPLFTLRAGVGDADADAFSLAQRDHGAEGLKSAFFVNALYGKDTVIGHSSAFNVKMADKSLLLNSNYNPYLGGRPPLQGTVWQAGADAAVRAPLGPVALSGEAQADFANYSNGNGYLNLYGGRAQVGVGYRPIEAALRYSVLVPDTRMGYTAAAPAAGFYPIFGSNGAPIQEITPSLTYFIKGEEVKLTFDLPILLDNPVAIEKGLGAYSLTSMPDQTSVLGAGGSVVRQTVVQGKMTLQYAF
ncbi:MAG: hypothetical protein FJZ01_08515 [Candidatus Sericytochromatia bacterium]|nr:hypothetical protein [Candidatus Tanganyikabacteria bacterium]